VVPLYIGYYGRKVYIKYWSSIVMKCEQCGNTFWEELNTDVISLISEVFCSEKCQKEYKDSF